MWNRLSVSTPYTSINVKPWTGSISIALDLTVVLSCYPEVIPSVQLLNWLFFLGILNTNAVALQQRCSYIQLLMPEAINITRCVIGAAATQETKP